MGREGEVVTALMPEFERLHPGIRVKVQQLPWTAAHEKLLTAFAGDVTPDICQLGNTWVPELVALNALEPLDRYVASWAIRLDPADYFAGCWTRTALAADCMVYRGTWIRVSCSTAGISSTTRASRTTTVVAAVDADAGRHRADSHVPIGTPSCCRSTRSSRSWPSRCNRTSHCSGTMDGGATSRVPASSARWRSISRCSGAAGRPWSRTRRSRMCGTSSAAAGSCSTCRDRGTSASCSAGCRPTSSRAGRRRRYPGLTARAPRSRRLQPGGVSRVAPPSGGVAPRGIPVAADRAAPVPCAHRRPAATTIVLARSAAGVGRPRARLSRAARARPAGAEDPRAGGASPPRCGWWPSARCVRGCRWTRPTRALDARTDQILEKRRWILTRRDGG